MPRRAPEERKQLEGAQPENPTWSTGTYMRRNMREPDQFLIFDPNVVIAQDTLVEW